MSGGHYDEEKRAGPYLLSLEQLLIAWDESVNGP